MRRSLQLIAPGVAAVPRSAPPGIRASGPSQLDGRLYARVTERVDDPAVFAALLQRAIDKYGPSYFAAQTGPDP